MSKSGSPVGEQGSFLSADGVIKTGFWINAVLMIMKLGAGYYGKSEAVLADGVESACDFVAIAVTYIAVRMGRQPLDGKHPYGHGKAESISAIFVSLIIFITGAGILVQAGHSIREGRTGSPGMVAVLAAVVTIGVKEWLYRYTKETGDRLESPAVQALAGDHRKDALTSIATLVGVTGAYFGFQIMDPLAAAFTALFIFHMGFVIFRSAAHDLMDGKPPEELISAVVALSEGIEGVEHVHQIRARRYGRYIVIDLKLDMDPEMTVKESHAISTEVKKRIFAKFPNVGDVMIHINPHDEAHKDMTRL